MRDSSRRFGGWKRDFEVASQSCDWDVRRGGNRGCGGGAAPIKGVVAIRGDPSSSIMTCPPMPFSGLAGKLLPLSPMNMLRPPSSIAPFKLLLCPGTLRIGLSSSANLNLAAALAIPHAGVGLSSGGDDDLPDPSWLCGLWPLARRDVVNCGGRTGEIMTKSSSFRGDGEGESLCLPFEEGKGDRNELGPVKGEGDGPLLIVVVDEDPDPEDELELVDDLPNGRSPNHVPGLFSVLRAGRAVMVEPDDRACLSRCIAAWCL